MRNEMSNYFRVSTILLVFIIVLKIIYINIILTLCFFQYKFTIPLNWAMDTSYLKESHIKAAILRKNKSLI